MDIIVQSFKPSPLLSPNARVHWAIKQREAHNAREKGCSLTAHACWLARAKDRGFVPRYYRIVWFYCGRTPDVDNIVARCKSFLDGCCDHFDIDDARLELAGVERIHVATRKESKEMAIVFSDSQDDLRYPASCAGCVTPCEEMSGRCCLFREKRGKEVRYE